MDALPRPEMPTGNVVVTPETYPVYIRETETLAAERTRDAERERDRARWMAVAGIVVGLLGVSAGAVAVYRSKPQGWIMAYDSATGNVGILQTIDRTKFGPLAENAFLRKYVEMREGFNEGTAQSDFDAVACASDLDEQKRFAKWFNDSREAPQQVFSRARNHGYRTATALSDPSTVGYAKSGDPRVSIRFRYEDQTGSEVPPKRVPGYATFTVSHGKKTPCDPLGLVVSQYERNLDLESQQP